MTKLIDPYQQRLDVQVEALCPGLAGSVDRLPAIDGEVALAVLRLLISYACKGTHEGAINAGRNAIASLPPGWLELNLDSAIHAELNLDDEWEFRRLLELLQIAHPKIMARFVRSGLSSTNVDVRTAAEDFASGRYGKIEGL